VSWSSAGLSKALTDNLTATVTRTVREIESTTATALRWFRGAASDHGTGWLLVRNGQRPVGQVMLVVRFDLDVQGLDGAGALGRG